MMTVVTVAAWLWVICGLIAWLENVVDWELRCLHFQRSDLAFYPACHCAGTDCAVDQSELETMSISHWGIFPGICWWRAGRSHHAIRWRELDFDFWSITNIDFHRWHAK
jgi:hypothetical protein